MNCIKCINSRNIPGEATIACVNEKATIEKSIVAEMMGWGLWPSSFDPIWIAACNGFNDDFSQYDHTKQIDIFALLENIIESGKF